MKTFVEQSNNVKHAMKQRINRREKKAHTDTIRTISQMKDETRKKDRKYKVSVGGFSTVSVVIAVNIWSVYYN